MKKIILACSIFFTVILTLSCLMPESVWGGETKNGYAEKIESKKESVDRDITTTTLSVICKGEGSIICTPMLTVTTTTNTTTTVLP